MVTRKQFQSSEPGSEVSSVGEPSAALDLPVVDFYPNTPPEISIEALCATIDEFLKLDWVQEQLEIRWQHAMTAQSEPFQLK